MTAIFALASACLFATLALAQPPSASPGAAIVRAVLASARLSSVADAPRYFRVQRISVPARQAATLGNTAAGFIYAQSGSVETSIGAERQVLAAGEAAAIAAGGSATMKALGNEPAVLLRFELLTAGELNKSDDGGPATVTELFRNASPIPGLKPGPYEFTLVRAAFPPRFPTNPPHRRSGAAVYYVAAGSGVFTAGGKSEP